MISTQDPSYLTLQATHAVLDSLIGETRFSKVDLGCFALGLVKSSHLSSHRFQRNTSPVNTMLRIQRELDHILQIPPCIQLAFRETFANSQPTPHDNDNCRLIIAFTSGSTNVIRYSRWALSTAESAHCCAWNLRLMV